MQKSQLKKRFKAIYGENFRLLAIVLDGFSHHIIYDQGDKNDDILTEIFSHYMPEGNWSLNAKKFFEGIGHSSYQNNAQGIVFVKSSKR